MFNLFCLTFAESVFSPFVGLLSKTLVAFTTSLSWVIIAIAIAIPWILFLLLAFWLILKFLRFWLHHKREMKAKKQMSNNAVA